MPFSPATSKWALTRPAAIRQGGFTLIEMIVVIVILAFVGGLVMVKQPWHSAGLNTDVTLRALTNGLRLARSRAIAQDRPVSVVTTAGGFSVDGGPPWLLPRGEALGSAQIIFTPDGGSTGATIPLDAGQRRILLTVNWLTGRVRATESTGR